MIDGFGIAYYRSFGSEMQLIGPLGKVNLFIGQNNSGKSNILSFLKERFRDNLSFSLRAGNQPYPSENGDDRFNREELNQKPFSLCISQENPGYKIYANNLSALKGQQLLERFLFMNSNDQKNLWVPFMFQKTPPQNNIRTDFIDKRIQESGLAPNELESFVSLVDGNTSGPIQERIKVVLNRVLQSIYLEKRKPERIEIIPAVRAIHDKSIFETILENESIIDRLARLERPPPDQQHLKLEFQKIVQFTKGVLENESVELEIPHNRQTISVLMDGKSLPIERLGTGIHEVVMLAATSTILTNTVICMEEPEIHLHPVLQKKLIGYLNENTSNQYMISTHSAHLLDYSNSKIFRVKNDGKETFINKIEKEKEIFDICKELGYKASDLIQSNCVIWVEGPSDRIYLNYWISKVDSNLKEGIHYSLMFYGGRLFSHLSFQEEDEEFIRLLYINRHSALVFDSDKKSSKARLSATKSRLKAEIEKTNGFLWITKGKEIENYFEKNLVQEALKEAHPKFQSHLASNIYSNYLSYKDHKGNKPEANKVKIAKLLIEKSPSLKVLDLKSKVEGLVKFIWDSNKISNT